MPVTSWIFIVGFGALGTYGCLNVAVPGTTIRWQNRATARHREDDPRRAVGIWFQRLAGQMDSAADGSRIRIVRRRVRYLGIGQIVIALVVIGVVVVVN